MEDMHPRNRYSSNEKKDDDREHHDDVHFGRLLCRFHNRCRTPFIEAHDYKIVRGYPLAVYQREAQRSRY